MSARGPVSRSKAPGYEYWGDGENVALVSSRVPPATFEAIARDVFWFRHRRMVTRVVLARLMPSVADRLRPQGLYTFVKVDPDLPLRRWLVWSVPSE